MNRTWSLMFHLYRLLPILIYDKEVSFSQYFVFWRQEIDVVANDLPFSFTVMCLVDPFEKVLWQQCEKFRQYWQPEFFFLFLTPLSTLSHELCNVLTHYHKIPQFDTLKIYSCRKHCEKRTTCLWQAISPFLTVFDHVWYSFSILNAL